ncbi:hypothetical protein KCP76_02780 [Salmonella enterica subsp. enterica serovar Weltevreden]|nr:hypothetical protein KCP76_02780 [Salmonella enterica subsp. enterica serovar Weltevreden]
MQKHRWPLCLAEGNCYLGRVEQHAGAGYTGCRSRTLITFTAGSTGHGTGRSSAGSNHQQNAQVMRGNQTKRVNGYSLYALSAAEPKIA